MTPGEIIEVRQDPRRWFQGFGRYRDEESRAPRRGLANVLQRRVFEHYRRCREAQRPCRMAVLKYRRAGASTAGAALTYVHAQNYHARLGVIGTDYKASANMLEMVKFYGEHDDFPGWMLRPQPAAERKIPWEEWFAGQELETVPFSERVERVIATRIEFGHDSTVELYTSKNPESARSAGLSGYHATEPGRWGAGGQQDAGETLTSMRNTLPKRGFHLALEESTANGAQGAFYETCRGARWPEYAEWPRQWAAQWPLDESEFGRDLQFVFIFAAWFEDERHIPREPLSPEQEERIRESLDDDERQLIARYQQEGPRGPRLGGEVEATVWEQLAWRRGIIRNVCTKGGAEEFKQEYPSDPREAFRASGRPALDPEGLTALETAARAAMAEYGQLTLQPANETVSWARQGREQATVARWEAPFEGGRYLVTCDPMTGADQVTGTGEKDRHAVFVLRDAYTDQHGRYHRLKAVARILPPCQWEDEVLTRQLWLLSLYYGGATIVVEGNAGAAILKSLHNEYQANVYQREELDTVTQRMTMKLGWWTDAISRRVIISTLQHAVREQLLDLPCPHAVGEMQTLIVDAKGKVRASASNHDDDPLALAIGLECMPQAHVYPRRGTVRRDDSVNERMWKEAV